jgi:hypothetical protein
MAFEISALRDRKALLVVYDSLLSKGANAMIACADRNTLVYRAVDSSAAI